MIEPNCDMPWDIYLDWLQDQGYEDLREVPLASLISVHYTELGNDLFHRTDVYPIGNGFSELTFFDCWNGDDVGSGYIGCGYSFR